MLEEYKRKVDFARNKRQEIKKFLDKLKKQKPSDLDKHCNELHDKAFEHIDCLQCANCCITTGPLLRDRDIAQLAKHIGTRPAEFTEKFLRIDEDKDYVFQKLPCPFLGKDNLCSVYDKRPNACAEYPHTSERKMINKLGITYHNSMICPAVAEVVEGLQEIYK